MSGIWRHCERSQNMDDKEFYRFQKPIDHVPLKFALMRSGLDVNGRQLDVDSFNQLRAEFVQWKMFVFSLLYCRAWYDNAVAKSEPGANGEERDERFTTYFLAEAAVKLPVHHENTARAKRSGRLRSKLATREEIMGHFQRDSLSTLYDGLYLATSRLVTEANIPGAGRGVFAAKFFQPNECITEYVGQVVYRDLVSRLRGCGQDTHVMSLESQHTCIAGLQAPEAFMGVGSFINDGGACPGFSNNARVREVWDKRTGTKRMVATATRLIRPGEEIFMSYSNGYWRADRQFRTAEGFSRVMQSAVDEVIEFYEVTRHKKLRDIPRVAAEAAAEAIDLEEVRRVPRSAPGRDDAEVQERMAHWQAARPELRKPPTRISDVTGDSVLTEELGSRALALAARGPPPLSQALCVDGRRGLCFPLGTSPAVIAQEIGARLTALLSGHGDAKRPDDGTRAATARTRPDTQLEASALRLPAVPAAARLPVSGATLSPSRVVTSLDDLDAQLVANICRRPQLRVLEAALQPSLAGIARAVGEVHGVVDGAGAADGEERPVGHVLTDHLLGLSTLPWAASLSPQGSASARTFSSACDDETRSNSTSSRRPTPEISEIAAVATKKRGRPPKARLYVRL